MHLLRAACHGAPAVAPAEVSQMLYERRVLTDVCCLGETLSPLIALHARHAVSMLQDFVLAYSTVGSAITAAHIASATRQPSGSTDSESAASARCVIHTPFVDPPAQQKALAHHHHACQSCSETAWAYIPLCQSPSQDISCLLAMHVLHDEG